MSTEQFPKGWHLKKLYEAPDGKKYSYGKEITEEPKQEPEQPKDQDVLIQQLMAEVANLRSEVRSQQPTAINVKQEKKPFGEYSDEGIGQDDYLPRPKVFIKHGRGYSMSSYIKDGRIVFAPHNVPLYFKKEHDEVTYHDGKATVIPFCQLVCDSKADAEFVESSPGFGVTIFPLSDINKIKGVDIEVIDKFEQAINRVQGMIDNELFAACSAKGINPRQAKEKLKEELIKAYMRDYIKQEEELIGRRHNEIVKDILEPPKV